MACKVVVIAVCILDVVSFDKISEPVRCKCHCCNNAHRTCTNNKDLIWIEQTACLDDGEIGIFYLDGNAYVKKFQNNRLGTYLISLNKKYDPIPVTENSSFKIFGRVLS